MREVCLHAESPATPLHRAPEGRPDGSRCTETSPGFGRAPDLSIRTAAPDLPGASSTRAAVPHCSITALLSLFIYKYIQCTADRAPEPRTTATAHPSGASPGTAAPGRAGGHHAQPHRAAALRRAWRDAPVPRDRPPRRWGSQRPPARLPRQRSSPCPGSPSPAWRWTAQPNLAAASVPPSQEAMGQACGDTA